VRRFDVIVIGAGAAGLAAARELSGRGKSVCIVEARERIGGRIFTLHEPDLALPVELGAEFIHGEVHATFAIVQAAALLAYELPDAHWWAAGGRWRRISGFWEQIDGLRAKIRDGADRSFLDFIKSQRNISPRLRRLAVMFVEGYHAAHADRISTLALRKSDGEQEEPGNKQFRIANGQDALTAWLRAGLDPERATILLGTVVTEVDWRRGDVAVRTARGEELRAAAAVITIPIGVWKAAAEAAGAIRFTPELRGQQRALAKLEVGHVVKIVFRFRERFWKDEGFVHSSDRWVPTWWTAVPVRAPLLTAWAGGHAADALLAEGREAAIGRAIESMAQAFRTPRGDIERLLGGAFLHDWQSDPFSRGAYTYAGVGGSGAHAQLAWPLQQTLFFAGEATSADQTGTVAGAIDSGRRAARQYLR
jgi:monoamine oxidase